MGMVKKKKEYWPCLESETELQGAGWSLGGKKTNELEDGGALSPMVCINYPFFFTFY